MNPAAIVSQWLTELHPELKLNEQGYCALANGDVALVAEARESTGQCHVFGVVMPRPEGSAFTAWLQEAMRLNLMGRPLLGCWLAYDPEDGALFLCRNFPIAKTDAAEFAAAVESMASVVVAVRERLSLDEETAADYRAEDALATA
jgi:Tir chaperone protein (CesT) family